jgi:hypothetical protein
VDKKLKKMEPKDDSTIAMSEDTSCKYCVALTQVNDPEEGDCPYCAREEAAAPIGTESCKYCAASNGTDGADCQYCNRPEVAAAAPGCKYCADAQTQDAGCEYCAPGPQTQNSTTTTSEDFAGQALDAPAIPKPIPGEELQEQVTPMDDTTNNNLLLDQNGTGESNVSGSAGPADINGDGQVSPAESVQVDQSKQAMQGIAQQIENDPSMGGAGPGPQGAATALATDAAAIVPGTDIIDGVSRPESYSQNSPSDMALDEDNTAVSPDLSSVLHEGLDSHADNIQRERVVQMVSQALTGFKACKPIIERSQTQAPQLYQSSIMMLKAMIEMAKMLGLSENGATPDQNPLEGNPQNEWQDPFATHPDNGGAPQAQAPQAPGTGSASTSGDSNNGNSWANPFPTHTDNGGSPEGAIGQPVGKLPTSATTQHVAREPLPPGAVNAQGQKKYVDPKTGKESFINMKEGRVLSPEGKPVKPIQG